MKKILVVVDMQHDFTDGVLGSAEAQAATDKAALKIKNFDGDIFITYDTHYDNYSETAEGRNLPVPHCIKNTPGWELNSKIAESLEGKNFTRVEKPTFGSLKLPEIIAEKYSSSELEIEIIGVCTDICVVSNALLLKANFPETAITVDSSCCAGVTPESHEAALLVMRQCHINIM